MSLQREQAQSSDSVGQRGYQDIPPRSRKEVKRQEECYSGRDKYGGDSYHNSDWKCLECLLWNYPDERRCRRCGAFAEALHHTSRKFREEAEQVEQREGGSRTRVRESLQSDLDLDEFGRVRPMKKIKKTKEKKKEWPCCFDTHCSDYVLDARSGMFYQAETNFFYDPQTKLYYSNDTSTYFRYDKAAFVAVQMVEPSNAASQQELLTPSSKLAQGKTKPSIAIKLKTKKLPKPSKKAAEGESIPNAQNSTDSSSSTLYQRQHQKDISKWSERQEESKQRKGGPPPEARSSGGIARTAKGEPICKLCQRKFPSVEKLEYHERVSKLHADNLAKRKKEQGQTTLTVSHTESAYVDRAQQRRQLYGEDREAANLAVASLSTDAVGRHDEQQTNESVRPDQTLGDNNVGNQLLQKLGWKSGKSIGRRQMTEQDVAGTNSTDDRLKKDWERIEALAAAAQQK